MTRRRTLLAAITAGTAGVTGCLGLLGDEGTEETGEQETLADSSTTPPPTQETDESATDEGDDETANGSEDTPIEFNVLVDEITECGRTCRTLDYTVQNRGTEDATGVVSRIRVYTPDTDGDQVFDDEQEIGDLDANTQRSATKDIDTGLVDGRKIQDNDGDIDIRVNLSSNEGETAEFVFDEELDV